MRQKKLFQVQIYCVDSNVLINLKHYRGDVFPTIWDRIEKMISDGELISHLEVFKEIEIGKDEIYEWCKKKEIKKMFKDIDKCQNKKIKKIKAAYTRDYWDRNSMKQVWADPWLIALAICEGAKIGTDEKNTQDRIPYVANHFGIECLNRFDFFNAIGIKY